METITVQAVYRNGVLRPRKKLNLPENSLVELKVKKAKASKQVAFRSLIGIWEHLPDSEMQDLETAILRVRKQSKIKAIW
ncbi:MAG: antitoxin family protein [Anaerolineales bacterium]|nr:antitoxin family protein [Anaerolineales bacterium]